jgi:hypothetical protein
VINATKAHHGVSDEPLGQSRNNRPTPQQSVRLDVPYADENTEGGSLSYIYRWDRQDRKGQPCEVLVRAKVMNSCLIRFADGYTMVTSRNALMRAPVDNSGGKRG